MPTGLKRILRRFETAKSRRSSWEDHWQDLADIMRPVRADFTVSSTTGARRTDLIYDSTPLLAARGLASATEDLLMPKADRWFNIRTDDPALNEEHEVKEWLERAEERMWETLYSPGARFSKAFAEAYLDLVVFGTAAVFIGEDKNRQGLSFRALHLKNFFILLNDEGAVDTMFLLDKLTARQAVQRYGAENLGEKTKEALRREKADDEKFDFVQAVFPREDRNRGSRLARDLPFASIDIDLSSEHEIRQGGYHEFPFAVMRWDTAAGEDYGRSPGMLALPDALTLNQMGKTILQAGHRAADPTIFVPADSVVSLKHRVPGGVSYFDAEALREAGMSQPFFEMGSKGNFPLTLDMQEKTREMVRAVFFKNVLDLPPSDRMTATEVIERKREVLRTVGPVFGRLQSDGPAPTVERSFGLMARAGAFDAPPDILAGREARFEFQSPVEKVRQSIDATAAQHAIELLAPFAGFDPTVLDYFDTDDIGRELPTGVSMPARWLRSREDVAALREARQAKQQAQEVLEQGLATAERLSQVEKNAPGSVSGEQEPSTA